MEWFGHEKETAGRIAYFYIRLFIPPAYIFDILFAFGYCLCVCRDPSLKQFFRDQNTFPILPIPYPLL